MAHRGDSRFYPENTIGAFKEAIDGGFEWLELDIMTTADKQIICSHNFDLEKETDGRGLINEVDCNNIKEINTGKFSHPNNQQEIPLLKSVINKLPTLAKFNFEIKTKSAFDFDTATRLMRVIKDLSPGRYMVSSFNPAVIVYFKIFYPKVPVGFLVKGWEWFWLVNWIHPTFINPRADMLTDDFFNFSKKRNLPILTWTIKNKVTLEWCEELQIQGIITDLSGAVVYERN